MTGGKVLWFPPTMNFGFLNSLPPPLRLLSNSKNWEPEPNPLLILSAPPEQSPPKHALSGPSLLIKSLRSIFQSWPVALPRRRTPLSTLFDARELNARSEAGCSLPLFRPYVAKVPWHGGVRAFLSQLFPRYGHYCGPNWSSGKDGGSLLWDRRPIDWLDFCCYCHDIGYDTNDQAKLLKADLAFLGCLEKPRMATKGDARVALLYRTMCIAGLRSIIIPYRMQLVRLQTGPSFGEVLANLIGKRNTCRKD